ncbi:3-keto-disaccharide hydrolase [Anditalea andensis]|uniref:3-keto-alpha-glucoside-1,2-lyase/3-keto-2-hydroxy-glucal hydratase domain-containing protein n=1 Tax=Anditalea andensis TaxID=1048983 RepID=A0A074L0B0_9BACT|nr:DUF1080 domain-containing protein [Anditalea andensis]KEO75651.1 hypothetical protein EL17_23815 [Anditalea andensis]
MHTNRKLCVRLGKGYLMVLLCLSGYQVTAQETIHLTTLDQFKDPGKSWTEAGEVQGSLTVDGSMKSSKGNGILVNIPTKREKGKDLYTNESFGDMDMEVDFLLTKGSNSGIYIQGMYEIQLIDSWTNVSPKSGDNGGIYERWDESRTGAKGYNGYAPRQNASKAPGLWQHLKVSFQAPRFDDLGNKIAPAKMIRVELNGVLIHDNVTLDGPTRGAMFSKEVAKGPLRLQGDHGAVAFRNLKVKTYDTPAPKLLDLSYILYEGEYQQLPDFASATAAQNNSASFLTGNIRTKSKQFLIRYKGKLQVEEAGDYHIALQVPGGMGNIKIAGQEVIELTRNGGQHMVKLQAGTHDFELVYSKFQDWVNSALGLSISGTGLRDTQYSQSAAPDRVGADPILVDPVTQPVLRSFMDLPGRIRVTHAVSAGSTNGVHYTYDLAHGSLIQVWRGGFLDATPMWNSRGDGSSRPRGAVQYFGEPAFAIGSQDADGVLVLNDTTGTGFKPEGYSIQDDPNHLAFQYRIHGLKVIDDIEILSSGEGIKRKITTDGEGNDLYIRVASASAIKEIENGLYLIGEKAYYIQFEGGQKPILKNASNTTELLLPVGTSVTYSMFF